MTTEQWEKMGWSTDTFSVFGVVTKWYALGGPWRVGVADHRGHANCHARLGFDPTVAEAKAALRMESNRYENIEYTREAVHAHIREHGSLEDCESITPADSDACPGCGERAGAGVVTRSGCKGDQEHLWHRRCFNRVRSRTEATPSGEPPPLLAIGDVVEAYFSEAENDRRWGGPWAIVGFGESAVTLVNANGRTMCRSRDQVRAAREDYGEYAARAVANAKAYAPAPVQPVEPRRFQPGDHIRDCYGGEHVVTKIEGDRVWVPRPGCAPCLMWWAASDCTLVTPVQQDGEAAPGAKPCDTDVGDCDVCLRSEHERREVKTGVLVCRFCFDRFKYEELCGPWDAGTTKPTPYVHEGASAPAHMLATDYGGNEVGFPRMPDGDDFHVIHEAISRAEGKRIIADTSPHKVDLWKSEPASVVLPFDAFMRSREDDQRQREEESYDPREGDEVEVATDYGSLPGVVMSGSRDHGVTVRVRSTDGHEIVVSESAYYVTLVRRPGGAR